MADDYLFGGDFDPDKQAAISINPVAPPISTDNSDHLFGGDFSSSTPPDKPQERYQTWPERLARGIAQAAGQTMVLPGQVAQGQFAVQPTTPGQWSDMDEARKQLADDALLKRTTQAAGIIGTGGIPGVTREGLSSIPLLNSGVPSEVADAAKTAIEKYGFPVTPGEMSQNHFVRTLNTLLGKLPGSGYAGVNAEKQAAIDRNLSSLIGQDSDTFNSSVMANAKKDLGNIYQKQIYTPEVKAPLDDQFSTGIMDTLDQAKRLLDNPDKVKPLENVVSNILDKVKGDGTISGPEYQGLRQTGSDLKTLQKTPGQVGDYAKDIQGHLDALFRRAIPEDKASLLADTDKKYAIMKAFQNLSPDSGPISGAKVMQVARAGAAGKERMAYGKGGDLGEFANILQRFGPMGSSNTGETSLLTKVLYGALAGGAGAGTAGMGVFMHDPLTAVSPLLAGVTGAATTRLIGQYMKSPTRAQKLIDDALRTGPQAPGMVRRIANKGSDIGIAPYLPAIQGSSPQ